MSRSKHWVRSNLARHYVPSIEVLEARVQLTGVPFTIPPALFNANVVFQQVGPNLIPATDPVDANTDSGNNYALLTQAFADVHDLSPTGFDGLPNDGFIAGDNGHPDAQLALFGTSANNARRADSNLSGAQSPSQFGFTVNVPVHAYTEVDAFMTGGNIVDVRFTLTLNYTDGTSVTSAPISVPDWFTSISSPGYTLISGLDRERVTQANYDDAATPAIWGFPVPADTHKQLASFRIDPVNVSGVMVFLGASGILAPTVTLSGNSSVLKDQTYALNLQYTQQSAIDHVTVNWGDGTIQDYPGQPASVTHVYKDAPNGYIIHAKALGDFGDVDSGSDLLVTVAVPEDGGAQGSNVVEPGHVETFTVGGISATTFNAHRLNNIIVTLGVYHDNPVDQSSSNVTTIGGQTFVTTPIGTQAEVISYEMRATTPLPGDVIIARFTIPNPGFLPNLFFFDEVTGTYLPVHGSTRFANSFVQVGDVFQVIFDETSFPTALLLRGTVFTITDAQALAPSLVTAVQAPPFRPPFNSADLGNLLDTGGGGRGPTGSTVGVIAPTQVNAFQPQNITSAADSPENAEGRRLSRQIQSVLDDVYEQMRNIFLPQLYFDPYAAETTPDANVSVPAPTPVVVELLADEVHEGIVLLSPAPVCVMEMALVPAAAKAADAPASLFSERALICLSLAALPIMIITDAPAPPAPERLKRNARR